MKYSASVLFSMLLSSCAAQSNFTANSIVSHEAEFRACVASEAKSMNQQQASSAEQIAGQATARCQGHLVVINDKLREENRWRHYYGSFADDYTSSLKERTISETASELPNKKWK